MNSSLNPRLARIRTPNLSKASAILASVVLGVTATQADIFPSISYYDNGVGNPTATLSTDGLAAHAVVLGGTPFTTPGTLRVDYGIYLFDSPIASGFSPMTPGSSVVALLNPDTSMNSFVWLSVSQVVAAGSPYKYYQEVYTELFTRRDPTFASDFIAYTAPGVSVYSTAALNPTATTAPTLANIQWLNVPVYTTPEPPGSTAIAGVGLAAFALLCWHRRRTSVVSSN